MAKKFFTVVINSNKRKVFMEDVAVICKRIKKVRPALPSYSMNTRMEVLEE
jgi:hypothetical protein